MWGRSGRLALMAVSAGCVSAGCIVPDYHLPAGFSSSYQRQVYGMDPGPPPQEVASIDTRPGIFYPETVFRDPPRTCDEGAMAGRGATGPMILGTDPLSPPPKVAKKPPDDF